MSPAAADVLVVGSGLTAALVALELARAGKRAVVLPARSAGERVLGHVPSGPPLAYGDAVRQWGRAGAGELWACQRRAYDVLRDEWGQACALRPEGGFTLATTRAEGVALAESEDLLRDDGFAGEFLDGYMLEARFAVRGFSAAYWAEGEAELDVALLTRSAAAAAEAAGAVFLENGGPAELSGRGARAATPDGEVSAPVAVVAAAAAEIVAGRLEERSARALELPSTARAAIPSPARVCGSGARWTGAGGRFRLELIADVDPAAFMADHLPDLDGAREESGPCPRLASRDGLPWIGRLPGLPVFLALGGTSDLAYEPLLSRWAVSELLTGRDTTPAPLRAARSPSAML
jgi:glycine/D-amino acid oxidase-like deaminating enzyme